MGSSSVFFKLNWIRLDKKKKVRESQKLSHFIEQGRCFVCTNFHGKPSNDCQDNLLKKQEMLEEIEGNATQEITRVIMDLTSENNE